MLIPRAVDWAEQQAAAVMAAGVPLDAKLREVARKAGVRHPERIRLFVADEIPLPDEGLLKSASGQVGLSQSIDARAHELHDRALH